MLNITNLKFNPFTPMNDLENRISPYNINTIPGKQVMRIEKKNQLGTKSWSNAKSSKKNQVW